MIISRNMIQNLSHCAVEDSYEVWSDVCPLLQVLRKAWTLNQNISPIFYLIRKFYSFRFIIINVIIMHD